MQRREGGRDFSPENAEAFRCFTPPPPPLRSAEVPDWSGKKGRRWVGAGQRQCLRNPSSSFLQHHLVPPPSSLLSSLIRRMILPFLSEFTLLLPSSSPHLIILEIGPCGIPRRRRPCGCRRGFSFSSTTFFCRREFSFVALFLLSLYECGCMWCIPPALPSFPFPRHCPPADAFRATVLLSFPQWMWRGGGKKPSSPPSFLPIHRSIRPILFGRKTDCGARKVMQCLPSPLADVRNSDVQSSASEDELEFTQKSWTDEGHFRVLFHD